GVEAELLAQTDEPRARYAPPLEVGQALRCAEVGVAVEGRQASEQDRVLALVVEHGGEAAGVADGDVPVEGGGGDRLEVLPAREDGGRALRAPARQAGEAVAAVAHQGEVVGDALR